MIYLGAGLIQTCVFENCKQKVMGSMLLHVNNAKINKTKFLSCHSDTSMDGGSFARGGTKNQSGVGCMIYSSNTCFIENEFSNCESKICFPFQKYGWCSLLLLDKNSSCAKCKFENISISGYLWDSRKPGTFVIGLRESKTEDNEGEISISRVSDIPKELFIVGYKQY